MKGIELAPLEREVEITWHAEKRMTEMGVTSEQVAEVVNDPEVSWTGTRRRGDIDHEETTAKRGPLTVVWINGWAGRAKVITVLWNTQDRYQRRDGD